MASIDAQIAEDIYGFYADFIGFVEYAFPWGEKHTELERFSGPFDWHRKIGSDLNKHIAENIRRAHAGEELEVWQSAVTSGHGVGKSAFVAWLILFFLSTRKVCRGVVTANTGDQLNTKTWPELAKWHRLAINKDWFEWTATAFWYKRDKAGHESRRVDAATWSEDRTEAFAGLHNAGGTVFTIYDEASAIPDSIHEVSEGALTDGEAFWFQFGNPTRNTGRFRRYFGDLREWWHTYRVDSRTVPITNRRKIKQWAKQYGEDSDFFRVRVRGVFPRASDDQFIPSDLVEAAQNRAVAPDKGAPLIMGVDVARSGASRTVVRFRQGRDARSIPASKFREPDHMQLAYRVAALIDQHKPDAVNIDAGYGSGLIDRLRELGYRVNEVWFGSTKTPDREYYNMRSWMWGQMKDWLGGGAIDRDEDLFMDLIGPETRYAGREGDKILLESKKDMIGRGLSSPDDGDALALTFAKRISRRDSNTSTFRRMQKGRVAKDVDYDIFGS